MLNKSHINYNIYYPYKTTYITYNYRIHNALLHSFAHLSFLYIAHPKFHSALVLFYTSHCNPIFRTPQPFLHTYQNHGSHLLTCSHRLYINLAPFALLLHSVQPCTGTLNPVPPCSIYISRPLLCIHYFLFSILTLTHDSFLGTLYAQPCRTFPIPCPFLIYPDRRSHNPVLDLLIPLGLVWGCTECNSISLLD